jgi:putative chitinase
VDTGLPLEFDMPVHLNSLSDHFSWEEAQITQVRDVDNTIPDELKKAVQFTANRMEYVRALLGAPIVVSSWYRSLEVNKRVGGSKTSQHMQGCAVDFICPRYGTPIEVCKKLIKYTDMINFDQLIYEHGWIHIGWNPIPHATQRNQVLTLLNNKKYAQGLTNKDGTALK